MICAWSKERIEGKYVAESFLELNDQALKDDVDFLVFKKIFSPLPKRVRGRYAVDGVVAVLDYSDSNCDSYQLEIKFSPDKKKFAEELEQMILSGRIWPQYRYEEEQVASPLRHLRDVWREFVAILHREMKEIMR